jgi:hypothetical protein
MRIERGHFGLLLVGLQCGNSSCRRSAANSSPNCSTMKASTSRTDSADVSNRCVATSGIHRPRIQDRHANIQICHFVFSLATSEKPSTAICKNRVSRVTGRREVIHGVFAMWLSPRFCRSANPGSDVRNRDVDALRCRTQADRTTHSCSRCGYYCISSRQVFHLASPVFHAMSTTAAATTTQSPI